MIENVTLMARAAWHALALAGWSAAVAVAVVAVGLYAWARLENGPR